MEKTKIRQVIEAILFTMGESVELGRLSEALETDKAEVKAVIEEMMQEYEDEDRGVRIIELDGAYQMCTKSETYEYLIKIISIPRENRLTDVQLETLSIIAYKQPVTKLEIEKIRGVSAEHTVNRLLEVGLIEEKGRLNTPGRPILFGTTEEFLRRFGLSSTDDLPDVNSERVESFRLEAEEELGFISDEESETPDEIINVEV